MSISSNKDEPLLPTSYQNTYGSTSNVGSNYSIYNNVNTPAVQILKSTSEDGISSEEAKRRLAHFGKNELPDNDESKLLKFLKGFTGPMPVRCMHGHS
jgi:magnesium-transporting ATPase (P-type)